MNLQIDLSLTNPLGAGNPNPALESSVASAWFTLSFYALDNLNPNITLDINWMSPVLYNIPFPTYGKFLCFVYQLLLVFSLGLTRFCSVL